MRVSMLRTEAFDNGVDASRQRLTDSVSSTYPNPVNTQPFAILNFVLVWLKDSEAYQVLDDTVGQVAAGAVTTTVGEGIGVLATVLPFPFDPVALVAEP